MKFIEEIIKRIHIIEDLFELRMSLSEISSEYSTIIINDYIKDVKEIKVYENEILKRLLPYS